MRIHPRSSDILLAAFLVAVAAMLFVPLPTRLLDLLIVTNLAVSMLVLLAGLYMQHALALLSFPSLLLLTTLFRVGLNVASTRLILTQGDAGQVIQAFGTFLVRGEVVVGLIIFLILTIVNFIVISRGAARVSEVAARFSLDALPGRQLSIDSDLRAGLISAEDAQRQREQLSKESQLYGSMDGAMKFVQGDAISGLVIIATNIFGGIYLGIRSGLSFSEAISTYTILTVGDGLTNQIPAILVSVCAGIVVTRVSAEPGSSLAIDVQRQIFARPASLIFSGLGLICFGLLQGIPFLPFFLVGAALLAIGFYQLRSSREVLPSSNSRTASSPVSLDRPSMLTVGASGRGDFCIILDSAVLWPMYVRERDSVTAWLNQLRSELKNVLGIPLPTLRVRSSSDLMPGNWFLEINSASVTRGNVAPDLHLLEIAPAFSCFFGIDVIQELAHPLFGTPGSLIKLNDVIEKSLSEGGVGTFSPLQVISLAVVKFLITNPEEVFSVSDVLQLEGQLERRMPGLLTQTLQRNFFTTSRIAEVMQQMVREGLSISDFTKIVELLAKYNATVGSTLVQEGEFDLNDIVSFIRLIRKKSLQEDWRTARGTLKLLRLSPEVEGRFEEGPSYADPVLLDGLLESVNPILHRGSLPTVVACRSDLRVRVSNFISAHRLPVGVISTEEVPLGANVECVGNWMGS